MSTAFPEILCTLGTTTDDPSVLAGMVAAGMGMARLNTAYASMEQIAGRIDLLRSTTHIPVLLDLKGPQLRVDCMTEHFDPETAQWTERPCPYPVEERDLIVVGFGTGLVRFNHDFRDDLVLGDLVTFANGTIRTRVADAGAEGIELPPDSVLLEVLEAGEGQMIPQMGANVPGKSLALPSLSSRDRKAIVLGVERGVEAWALSFVRGPEDIERLDRVLREHGDIEGMIIPKIEESLGIAALEDIVGAIAATGRGAAVMIARGDLFVELDPIALPAIQDDLVQRCRALGVPSIVATGLLLAMQEAPRPSRAEVSDVAAALRGGADSLMLSDETANSRFPVEATATLAALIQAYRP